MLSPTPFDRSIQPTQEVNEKLEESKSCDDSDTHPIKPLPSTFNNKSGDR